MTSRLTRGFFHRDLSRSEAEKLLKDSQVNGSFLLRTSKTKNNAYVLSARRENGDILHRHIQRTSEGFTLSDGKEFFPTLYDLIDYYRRNNSELSEKSHERVPLTHPLFASPPTTEKYYHGSISHIFVKFLLDQTDQIGTYLVRDSETDPSDYVICMKTSDDIINVKIKSSKGYFYLEGRTSNQPIDSFKSLDELVHFYQSHNPLVGTNRMKFRLIQAFRSTSFLFRDIHQRSEYLSRTFLTANGPRTGFSLEFEWLNQQCESQSHQYHKHEGEKAENRTRNRFRNILPYDETRVILKNYPPTDYMNANRIRSPFDNLRREYIAAQGPLSNTINDFWHMVQQELVTCILMITREIENAKIKCARYWPEVNTKKQYGTVWVENLSETNFAPIPTSRALRALSSLPQVPGDTECSYRLRILRLTREDGQQWDIQHWQYLAWGDHDSPLTSNARDPKQLNTLFEFFKRFAHSTNHVVEQHASPIIVHCSAGIGRSGSTIAIDLLLHRIEQEGLNTEIDISSLVKYIRSKRSGLVQTERQYELIYRLLEFYLEHYQLPSNSS